MVNMTKRKLPIRLGVEQSIAGKKDVNRLSCVCPELGEFATLFITFSIRLVRDFKAANLSQAMNLIKGSSNNLAQTLALILCCVISS